MGLRPLLWSVPSPDSIPEWRGGNNYDDSGVYPNSWPDQIPALDYSYGERGTDLAVSIKDVAARSGVSIATVSHVLNGTGAVSDITRSRIRSLIETAGYIPNEHARELALARSRKEQNTI